MGELQAMKSTRMSVWMGLITALWLGGCANLTSPARMHELTENKSYWLDYDASRRGTIITYKNANGQPMTTCAEPAPDVALALTSKLLGEVKVTPPSGGTAVDAKAEAEFRSNVVDLAKRTQTIMFVREAMYRLCEQALNGHLPQGAVQKLYQEILELSVKLAEAEVATERRRMADAVKDTPNQKFLEDLLKK
jgi:hypothetical protein